MGQDAWQLTLDGRDCVDMAVERIKMLEPPDGYVLAFSGGKDSIAVKRLADLAGVKYTAWYNSTTIDPPDLVAFIREHHPDVQWHMPQASFFRLLIKERFPPLRHIRWCCGHLKENHLNGVILTGVRAQESPRRKMRRMTEPCLKKGAHRVFVHPIIDWSEAEVWQFIKAQGMPYCSLYDEGFKRLGCLFCPMKPTADKERERARYPKYEHAFRLAFKRLWDFRQERGMTLERWADSDAMFEWWLLHDGHRSTKSQGELFFTEGGG